MKSSKREEESERSFRQRNKLQRLGFKSGEIATNEYDFGPVPDEELEACCFYEYARESASVIHSALKWGQNAKTAGKTRHSKHASYVSSPDVKELNTGTGEGSGVNLAKSDIIFSNADQVVGAQPLASGIDPGSYITAEAPTEAEIHSKGNFWMAPALANISTFPRSTWQSLPPHERTYLGRFGEIVRSLIDPVLEFQIDEEMGKDSVAKWKERTWGMIKGPNIRTGFFRVSGNSRIKEMVKTFEAWLLKELSGAEHGTPGRNSVRDTLNALGAMRLRFCYGSFEQAQNRTDQKNDNKKGPSLFYRSRKGMDTAADNTINVLQLLFESGKREIPVHYSQAW